MQRSRYSFVLDLQSTETQICLVASQGDTRREIAITFSDGGVPFGLDGADTVEIYIDGAGGTLIESCDLVKIDAKNESDDAEYSVLYPFSAQTCANEGLHKCRLNILGKSGTLWSPPFSLFVAPKKTQTT